MVMRTKKYRPDLKVFMALCASNYAKMCRLLPESRPESQAEPKKLDSQFCKTIQIEQQPELQIRLLQSSRYTQTFQLLQQDLENHLSRDYCVRLYHDAQMAEVLSGVNDAMLAPVYPVPNDEMKQVDEKLQLNRFLAEWLSFCLQYAKIDVNYKTQLAFLS